MERNKLVFVKDLVIDQKKFVENAKEEGYNRIAAGLFRNDEVNSVLFELFGPDFLRVIKSEIGAEPRDYILLQFDMIVEKIDKEILRIEFNNNDS